MAISSHKICIIGTAITLSIFSFHGTAHAQAEMREAQIVVDVETSEVLYENYARDSRRPASITKVMTLYLLFDALSKGQITWDDRITFSRNAANQPPTKLFVAAGDSIPVQTAVEALVLRSANDVATAVAERLGGSEANFAQLMTVKARELGMQNTTFRNASGLPNATQRTTAEDLARLAIAIQRDFPEQYHWFSARQMTWNGQIITGHNHLMGRMIGMNGLKTGYTNASGFNLAATTQRNGRKIVTVVLGGANRFQRDDLVEALTESAFKELGIGATLFAANTTAYEINFRDSRDAADAAALVMDLPPRRVATSGVTTIAMARSGRRLGFEQGAPVFMVADMSRSMPTRTMSAPLNQTDQRDNSDTSATDEGEADVAHPVPFKSSLPVRVAVVSSTTSASTITPSQAPVNFTNMVSPTRAFPDGYQQPPAVPMNVASAQFQSPSIYNEGTQLGNKLKGTLEMADNTESPTQITADTDTALAQNEALPPRANGARPTQMATLESDAVVQARRRQFEANAREQIRMDQAQSVENTRREAARVQAAMTARILATRLANERRAERQLAETRANALKEREARAQVFAERQAVLERATAARVEDRRQTDATRLRNTRGTAIVQVGAFKDKNDAQAAIAQFSRFFPSFAQREVSTVSRGDGVWYRARFAGLGAIAAREACSLVSGRGGACQIVGQ